jgi:hypothetical protein
MAVSRPQPWSLTGRATSIPSAWRAATVAATSSVMRYSPRPGHPRRPGGRRARPAAGQRSASHRRHPPTGSPAPWPGRPGGVGVVAVEDGVGTVDHSGILSLAGPAVGTAGAVDGPQTMTHERWSDARVEAAPSKCRKRALTGRQVSVSLARLRSAPTWENGVEHSGSRWFADTEGVTGSNPVAPTNKTLTSGNADGPVPSHGRSGQESI